MRPEPEMVTTGGDDRTGGSLWQATLDYFSTAEWSVRAHEAEGVIETAFKGEHGKWTCAARVIAESGHLLFYSLSPMDAAPDMIAPLNELMTRANYGLILGNFEVNLDSGAFRYKTSMQVDSDAPSRSLLESLFVTNVLTMDRYLPAVHRLLYAGASVAEALAQVEG